MSEDVKRLQRASMGAGPTFMTNAQKATYLKDLRSYKPSRPLGSRPSPFASRILRDAVEDSPELPHQDLSAAAPPVNSGPQRNGSTASHQRSQSAAPVMLGRPLVREPGRSDSPAPTNNSTESGTSHNPPPVEYIPSGRRWMEKQEAVSLRRAMEDMDLAEEARIHNAAQAEASELVWKHRNADAPYKYKEHLRKGSYHRRHSSSVRTASGSSQETGVSARDFAADRVSLSGSSDRSSSALTGREPSKSKVALGILAFQKGVTGASDSRQGEDRAKIKFAESIFGHARRRSSGGSSRKTSGHNTKSVFSDPNDKIYEEPEETSSKPVSNAPVQPSPVPTRRNPFARLRSTRANISPVPVASAPLQEQKRPDVFEIQKNTPSQSRNPDYVSNESLFSYNATAELPPPGHSNEDLARMKDGKEIRSTDIRAATSKKLNDRSSNLPTPVYVSDSPGRPIVSFREPKQITLQEEVSRVDAKAPSLIVQPPDMSEQRPPASPGATSYEAGVQSRDNQRRNLPPRTSSWQPAAPNTLASNTPSIPTINFPDSPAVPAIAVSPPSIPSITVHQSGPPVPSITVNDAPPAIPSISVSPSPSVPSVKVDAPTVPEISISFGDPPNPPPNRPLPTPTKQPAPTQPAHRQSTQSRPHWSPAGSQRATVLCTFCALPIAGRIVSAAGSRFHPGCFRCYHCSEALECVAFYPEPDNVRNERVSRIRARLNNEHVRASESSTADEDRALEESDGWTEDSRFYCHLDFHEFFSPRCKSCKTPIEGEVIVACGAEWHAGHFFCAQCGDPFDASTPFVEKDGYAWCVNCHTHRYSTKCKKCRRPVVDMVVNALGAEWHEQCFSCTECSGPFADGRYFVRPGGQDPVCVGCEERRLKA